MKVRRIILFLVCIPIFGFAQDQESILTGSVTYVTSKNVYVRFAQTEPIAVGDTLIWKDSDLVSHALFVLQKSSTSCVTEPLDGAFPAVGQSIRFKIPVKIIPQAQTQIDPIIPENQIAPAVTLDNDTITNGDESGTLKKQSMNGRMTLSTNASIQPGQTENFQRIRASVAFNLTNIHQSDFSLQTYFTYRHRYGVDQSTTDFYDDFKVLALAVNWKPSDAFQGWIGRRNNPNMANLGAIDGIQTEWKKGKYILGAFLGTRPDFSNFTFNASLPQAGVYLARLDQWKGSKQAQTSIALAEQQNDFKTDRRFVYFQHSNQIIKNLNFFISSELELFKKINGEVSTKPSLTSFYVSLRYRIFKNLSFTGSYDNRRNVIYYESYQTYIDQFLAQETRQGLRFQAQWNIWKKVQLFGTTFYRFQGDKPNPTKNYIGAINFNRIAGNRVNVNISFNRLESYYFKGNIAAGKISDQFFKGRMQIELQYRNINYTFFSTESVLKQHITGVNINLLWFKNTSVVLSYENTLEPSRVWHRYFITVSQRLKN